MVTTPAPVTFTVDPWDPGYGLAFSEDLDGGTLGESSAELDLDLELPAAEWRPVDPNPVPHLPSTVLFADGVRRIDARIWVHGRHPQPVPGIAASFAAGLVSCDGTARIADVTVERGMFTAAAEATDIITRHARYPARLARSGDPDQLSLALQQRLTETEVQLALTFRAQNPAGDDLLVVDGPLRGRTHLDRTVGYIKTHHASYLPSEQAATVAALMPGQRTPAFTMGTSWRRNSWYLQLAGTPGVPWSGIVRLECSADLRAAEVIRLADVTTRLLPPLASSPHKDPRAPQNLVPIGGLERELRHRLGDQQLLYRSLRAAAATWPAPTKTGSLARLRPGYDILSNHGDAAPGTIFAAADCRSQHEILVPAGVIPGARRFQRLSFPGHLHAAPFKLGADLRGVEGVARGEIFAGLPQVGKRFLIAEDVQGLLHGLVFGDRDEHDMGAAVAGDGEVIVFAGEPVKRQRP